LGDGSRVSKGSRRVGAYGAVDELNAVVGVLLAEALPSPAAADLTRVQALLFDAADRRRRLEESVVDVLRSAGLREVILPVENEKDLEDIPEDVRSVMQFHLVKEMDEVIALALVGPLPAENTVAAAGDVTRPGETLPHQ